MHGRTDAHKHTKQADLGTVAVIVVGHILLSHQTVISGTAEEQRAGAYATKALVIPDGLS